MSGIDLVGLRRMLDQAADVVDEINTANGWFDEERTVGEGVALLMSEGAEALDAWRKYGFAPLHECAAEHIDPEEPHLPTCKPVGYGSELADVLVRLLDEARRQNVDLAYEFVHKLNYNRTRGYRHGGRRV